MAAITAPILAIIVGIPIVLLAWYAYEVISFDSGTIMGRGGSA